MILLRTANFITFDLGLNGGGDAPLAGAHIFLVGTVEVDVMNPMPAAVWFRSANSWVNIGSYGIPFSDAFSLSDSRGWLQGTVRISLLQRICC